MIIDDLQECGLSKEIILQITVKTINNIASPNGLVPTLLVFEAYPHILEFDSHAPIIIQHIVVIKSVIKEVQKVRAKR